MSDSGHILFQIVNKWPKWSSL